MSLPLLLWPGPRESGEVAGTTFFSGTITGAEGAFGSVTGTTTFTGTITGRAARNPTSGKPWWHRYPWPEPEPPQRQVERKSGTVVGKTYVVGHVHGRRGANAPRIRRDIALRCHVTGIKTTTAVVVARTTVRSRVTGTGAEIISLADLRRMRDDAELLLII